MSKNVIVWDNHKIWIKFLGLAFGKQNLLSFANFNYRKYGKEHASEPTNETDGNLKT